MAWIDESLKHFLEDNFKDRIVKGYCEYRSWQTSRYVFVTTCMKEDMDIHYEYYHNHVELHLEGKFQSDDYRDFVNELRLRTAKNPQLSWHTWQDKRQCRCRIDGKTDSWEDLLQTFKSIMEMIDPIIEEIGKTHIRSLDLNAYKGQTGLKENGLEEDEVSLETCCLGQIFSNNLVIPDYQRNYCWEKKHIDNLWASLKEIPARGHYHLGTIILQKQDDGRYAVIDGQQRLVSLTLILDDLNYKGDLPLLKQSFRSNVSKKQIAENKWTIRNLCRHLHENDFCQKLIRQLSFSVLILKESRLDLAYTFFSNQNAKGVELSDYDLLKAHHLRYIPNECQQEHMAERWNTLIEKEYRKLDAVLSTHLFRLRKWMRKKDFDPTEIHRVRDEFSAAPLIPEIPPFGENFDFYEKIQGGAHFFAYADSFVERFSTFEKTRQVLSLRNHLRGESHYRYESVIETLLFGYYLKFGTRYLSEALMYIAENIAQHRYQSRANYYKIREFAKNSEIIMMIDQASSPTFFLYECQAQTSVHGKDVDLEGIRMRFYHKIEDIKDDLFQLK